MAVALQSPKKESKPVAKAPEPKTAAPEPRREAVRSPLFLGGQPLQPALRRGLEGSFGVGLDAVRVHNDTRAQNAAQNLSSRAFAYGNAIFLGRNESPHDPALMGHEVAHVIQQQGAAAVQRWSPAYTDRFESEAHRAGSAAVKGETFQVHERTNGATVQRLGISDALDYFADKANIIPGFRMFTLVIGINPINMSRVERTTANVLRAVVELIPLGGIISQVLDKYGVFDKVAAFINGQLTSLGISGASIRAALDEFLDSLHWRDIFHLGDVWDRAVHIFSDPIHRIITFASNLVGAILRFVREAVLRPLADLAKGTAGWDLLKAVIGQDPITGEPVPRNADTLVGGFMKMIGHEEVWENIKKGNAIGRAWTWFQTALSELLGFVREIPGLFIQALESLEISDFIFLPNAFVKVGRVFGSFAGRFLSWGLKQVLNLLQIIVEVVAPGVMPYIQKAAGAFRTIIQNPIGFVGNLVRAGKQGFLQFGSNFLTHLRTALIQWLTGTLSGANVYIPQAFEIKEIIKFVLSVLGLTWQNIRGKLVKVIGETAVKAMETGFDLVVTLVRDGPAAAWDKIREAISNLREMVMEQIMTFVRERIVQAAITKLVTSLNPAGAFIQAIIATYNTIMFFVERLQQIARVVMAFIDSIAAIAAGNIGSAANRVEQTMAGLLTLVISFLARLVGLGKVSDAVVAIINRIREPIDRALDRVIEWIVSMARQVGRFVAQAGVPQDPNERLRLAARDSLVVSRGLTGRVTPAVISTALRFIQTRYALTSLDVSQSADGTWIATGVINPALTWRLPVAGETFGAGIREVAENPVTAAGVHEAGVRGELLPGMPRATAPNYNTMMPGIGTVPVSVQHFIQGYQWAHLWGPGFGAEARTGLMLASPQVNQELQSRGRVYGLEGFFARIGRRVRAVGGNIYVEVTATSFRDPPPGVPIAIGQPLLREVNYRVVIHLPGGVQLGGTASIRCGVPMPNGTGGQGTPFVIDLAKIESEIPA